MDVKSLSQTDAAYIAGFIDAVYNCQALNLLGQIHAYLRSYKANRSALILRDYIALTPRNGKLAKNSKLQFWRLSHANSTNQ